MRTDSCCAAFALFCVVSAAGVANAQEPTAGSTRSRQGFAIDGVSLSLTHASQTIPTGITTFRDSTYLGPSNTLTADASISWRKKTRNTYFDWDSTSLLGRRSEQRTSDWNESMSLHIATTPRNSRWKFAAGGNGAVMSFDEALFFTRTYPRALETHGNVNDLANTVTPGGAGDPALAQSLYGRRTAHAAGQASVAMARSRLSTTLKIGGIHLRHLEDASDVAELVYPRFTSMYVGSTVQYALNPRASVGIDGWVSRTNSSLLKNSGTSWSVFGTRKMRRWWSVEGSIGAGMNTAAATSNETLTYSAGVGFSSGNHDALASYGRHVTNAYIVALGPTSAYFTTITAAWQWHQRRYKWWVSADFSHFVDAPPGQPAPHTWETHETFGWRLGRNYALTVLYAAGRMGSRRYIQDKKQYQLAQSAVRMSIRWSPMSNAARRPETSDNSAPSTTAWLR